MYNLYFKGLIMFKMDYKVSQLDLTQSTPSVSILEL